MIDIDKLSWVAKIELDEKEKEKMRKDMEKILRFLSVIKNVNVSIDSFEFFVFRDFPKKCLRKFRGEKIISNFPKKERRYLEVPIFLK